MKKLYDFILSSTKGLQKYILGMFVCSLIIGIDANLKPYIIKLLIDQAGNFSLHSFVILGSIYLASQVAMVASYTLNDWLGTKFHSSYRALIPHIFIDRISNYSYNFFQDNMAGSITAKISDAFNFVFVIIYRVVCTFATFIITVGITIYLLCTVSYLIAIAAIAWIIFYLGFSWYFFKKSSKYNDAYAPLRPKLYGFLSDYVTNILSIWCFSNKKLEKDNLTKITDEFRDQAQIYGAFLRNSYFLQGLSVTFYSAFVLYILGLQSLHGTITAGDYVLVFMVSYKIGDLLFTIAQEMLGFSQNIGAASSAIELLDFSIEIADGSKALKLTKGKIQFEKVKFHYKNVPNIFEGTNITLHPGEKIGLVGYSGSGKSTFVNLILRLYDASSGRILIDGQDIKEVTLESLRHNIATIPQDPSLFHRTIMENIRYGRLNATDKEVIDAAKMAGAHEFIESLPEKYNTLVGERGIKLSGGQRQRIAIARAFLKNAPILILDEATSQLDSITEEKIQESLRELMRHSSRRHSEARSAVRIQENNNAGSLRRFAALDDGIGKTTIVIAHRLSTLLHMDRILVFDKGKIVQDGSHKELLKQKGLYKTLWEAQVGGFLPERKK